MEASNINTFGKADKLVKLLKEKYSTPQERVLALKDMMSKKDKVTGMGAIGKPAQSEASKLSNGINLVLKKYHL